MHGFRRNALRGLPWVLLLVLAAALLLVVLPRSGDVSQVASRYGLVGVGVTVVLFLLTNLVFARRRTVDKAVDELAAALAARYDAELRPVYDPAPLPVRWAARASTATGEMTGVSAFFRDEVPNGRLVVLGADGAGKTVLAVRLAADLLRNRDGGPVPVVLSIADWNLEHDLGAWIAEELAASFGLLRQKANRSIEDVVNPLAVELATSAHVLPVLDGFDELPPKARKRALALINEIGSHRQVVLVSRTKEYDRTVADSRGLSSATVIEVAPLRPEDTESYLVEGTDRGARRWAEVFAEVRRDPGGTLAWSLSTPLMAWLARIVYLDAETRPDELAALGNHTAIRDHLFDRLLPALLDGHGGVHRTKARHWLHALAHLAEEGDLAWWRLIDATPENFAARSGRAVVTGVAVVTTLVMFSLAAGLFAGVFATAVLGAVAVGFHRLSRRWAWRDAEPSQVRIRPSRAGFALRLAAVLAVVGLGAVSLWSTSRLSVDTFLLVLGLALALSQVVGTPAEQDQATSPLLLLRDDRTLALVRGFIVGPVVGVAAGLVFASSLPTASAVAAGIGFGLIGWFGGVSGHRVVQARGGSDLAGVARRAAVGGDGVPAGSPEVGRAAPNRCRVPVPPRAVARTAGDRPVRRRAGDRSRRIAGRGPSGSRCRRTSTPRGSQGRRSRWSGRSGPACGFRRCG